MSLGDRNSYWNSYYSRQTVQDLSVPSQFGAFVANEFKSARAIVDVACGSGRDSFFFARHFESVLGIDQSESAIERCRDIRQAHGISNTGFEVVSAVADRFVETVRALKSRQGDGQTVIYARFFLHAITEEEEERFFDNVAGALDVNDALALEYRTVRDASNVKSTPDHFRRFVQPALVLSAMTTRGFCVDYSVEGFGLAKYRQDDAYVARSLHRKVHA